MPTYPIGKIPAEDDLPEMREDLKDFEIDYEQLDEQQTARHATFNENLFEYLEMEADGFVKESFQFVRTALIDGSRYWAYKYNEEDGTLSYAVVSENPQGQICIGCDWAEGLTIEQALLAEHYACY